MSWHNALYVAGCDNAHTCRSWRTGNSTAKVYSGRLITHIHVYGIERTGHTHTCPCLWDRTGHFWSGSGTRWAMGWLTDENLFQNSWYKLKQLINGWNLSDCSDTWLMCDLEGTWKSAERLSESMPRRWGSWWQSTRWKKLKLTIRSIENVKQKTN